MAKDPRNVPGEFYVEKDCCLQCGIPWQFAPELFGMDENNAGCWVKRQPSNAEERRAMFKVLEFQELDCIRSAETAPSMLKRYWFTFEESHRPSPLNLGCGVSARDFNDALVLLRKRIPAQLRIRHCTEDVDVSTLDSAHVLPNIGDVTRRGIWFPLSA